MKRFNVLSIFVLVAMIAGMLGFAAPVLAAGPSLTTPVFSAQTVGSTVTVPVSIDTGTGAILGWGFNLAWNPAVLSLTSWTEGPFLSSAAAAVLPAGTASTFRVGGTINNTAGTLVGATVAGLGFPAGTGVTGAGVIANLTFTVIGAGKANFAFSNVLIPNQANTNVGTGYLLAPGGFRAGPSPVLAVKSVAFTPASGSMTTSAVVTIVNNGAAMVAGDDTSVTVAMTNTTPAATVTSVVSLLAANATTTITLPATITAGQTSSHLTVSDTVYGITGAADYFASITSTQPVTVDATFNTTMTLTVASGAISFNPLALGLNQQYSGMTVTSNANTWTVSAAVTNGWKLSEWNGTAFVAGGKKLADPLGLYAFRGTVAAGSITTGVDGVLTSGVVAGQSLDAGEAFNLTYQQTRHVGDGVVTSPNTYHAVVTLTAAAGL
jgi:hypothetical protein